VPQVLRRALATSADHSHDDVRTTDETLERVVALADRNPRKVFKL
jgi:hypothetical protein